MLNSRKEREERTSLKVDVSREEGKSGWIRYETMNRVGSRTAKVNKSPGRER